MARSRVVNLVTDGDSNTAGRPGGSMVLSTEPWPRVAEALFAADPTLRRWSVKSIAVSGAQTLVRSNAYPTQGRPLFDARFGLNVITFWEGTNDFRTAQLDVSTVIQQTKDYSSMVRRDGWSLQLITPLRNTTSSNWKILELTDWLLSPAARPYSTFPVLDVAADPRLVDPTDAVHWQSDGVHPTPAGHAVIAELIHARLIAL